MGAAGSRPTAQGLGVGPALGGSLFFSKLAGDGCEKDALPSGLLIFQFPLGDEFEKKRGAPRVHGLFFEYVLVGGV